MEVKKIAAMAEAYSMRIQPHVCASPVATAAALQLDACLANFIIQEVYPYRSAEHFQIVDHAPESEIKHGSIPIPNRAGFGVNLVEARVRPFLWAQCSC
jgi:galactonate dehydratase